MGTFAAPPSFMKMLQSSTPSSLMGNLPGAIAANFLLLYTLVGPGDMLFACTRLTNSFMPCQSLWMQR